MRKEAALNVIAMMAMMQDRGNSPELVKAASIWPTLLGVGLLGGIPYAMSRIEKGKREAAEKAQKEMMQTWGPFIQGLIGSRGNIGYQDAINRMG